jgi:hypothetical protein
MMERKWHLDTNRFYNPDPAQLRVARELYEATVRLPRETLIEVA